jgi:putative ABC transport system permease protein
MFFNFIKIAVRNLGRNKLFSFINIFGLALSMSVCLIVLVRIKDQTGHDRFHPHPDRTYRLITEFTNEQGNRYRLASSPLPLAPYFKDKYNLIESSVRLYPYGERNVVTNEKTLSLSTCFADPGLFSVFGFKLKQGNPGIALSEPNKIVLNQSSAQKFFGSTDVLGKTITLANLGEFVITGVMDIPSGKSHINFDLFISMGSLPVLEKSGLLTPVSENWNPGTPSYTYVVLKKDISQKQLANATAQISADLSRDWKRKGKEGMMYEAQSFRKINMGEELVNNLGNTGSRGKILAEIAISLVILLSACFNYTNLSLARSLKRGKEVGVRKVAGAFRSQIFYQFVLESVFISLLSLGLACIFLKLIMDYAPFRYEMIPDGAIIDASTFGWFLVFSIFTGLLAGVLPAWMLSSFKPVEVLKNLSGIKLFGSQGLRKTLIVIQFALSLVIIIFTLTFFRQFRYMATADAGFDVRNMLSIPMHTSSPLALKQRMLQIPGVEMVSAVSSNPGKGSTGIVSLKQKKELDAVGMDYYDVDPQFFKSIKLDLLAGQRFQEKPNYEKEDEIVISNTAVLILGLGNPSAAVGQVVWLSDSIPVRVAGIVKDFYHMGLESPYRPLVFRNRPERFKYLNIRTNSADPKSVESAVAIVWKQFHPNESFEGWWLDKELYQRKSAWTTISMLGFLAIISVTLACLGLLGMVVYNTETRRKEIGIRKVMGASVAAIISLVSRSFIRLVVLSGLIALPLSYLLGYFFLSLFANRVNMGFVVLLLSFSGMLLLSLLITGSQVYKAAAGNPVESLREEG